MNKFQNLLNRLIKMDVSYNKIKKEAEEIQTMIRRKKRKNEFCPEIPRNYCGYVRFKLKRELFHFSPPKHRCYVSLAMYNFNSPLLKAYANKLPIMCINTYRLEYTINAFRLSSIHNFDIPEALEFYLKFEIENIDMSVSQNFRFSKLLHSLKTSGSEKYIVMLATYLEFSFDIIQPYGYVYRYQTKKQIDNFHAPAYGVLTSLQINKDWIVEPTLNFITKTKDMTHAEK